MFNLFQIELKKILKKKSIYIIWILMVIFCLLNNILYLTDYDEDGNYKYLEKQNLIEEKTQLKSELNKYNPNNKDDLTTYITIKTKLDIINIKQKFKENSWQYNQITNYLYDTIYKYNYLKYTKEDNYKLEEINEYYQTIIDKLNNNDYKYFLNQKIKNTTSNIKQLKEEYVLTKDKKIKQELSAKIKENNLDLKILNYRLKNNIKEDNSYLNSALLNYQENYKTVEYFKNINHLKTHRDKLDYQNAISDMEISKYIIETKININKQNNLNYQLRTILEDYELFIVILILIISSIIICDEFKDGTIKLLLIKPYSRGKILLSKFLTTILITIISIVILIILELSIGGYIFGLDSLNIPVVVFDFNLNKIIEYSVFEYMFIRIIYKIPFLLILTTISILLGLISKSTIVTTTLPLMLYIFNPTIINIVNQHELKFMKYLVNINWDLQNYLFGKLPNLSFINIKLSIIILILYFIIITLTSFIIFTKKDIKNI